MLKKPKWDSAKNLLDHYYKHPAGEDAGCWSDLLNKKDGQLAAKEEYEDKAEDVIQRRWFEYCAEFRDRSHIPSPGESLDNSYREKRRYFIDDNLVTTITSDDGYNIVTCFHEHFDLRHIPLKKQAPTGELRDRYRTAVQDWQKCGRVRKFMEIHNESQ